MTAVLNGSTGGAPLSDATPAAPGTAAAGVSTSASRGDHVHTPTTAAQAGALAASTLTTRGDLLRRGASAAERVALGAAGTLLRSDGTDPAWSTLTIPDTAARGTLLAASAANVVSALTLGAAGTRLTSDGTDPVWQSPDVVCTTAELATTYAPSAALRGLIAYTSDEQITYVCRRTAASTYAWVIVAYSSIAEPTTQPLLRYKLDEAAGATTLVNSGSASSANLTLAGSAFMLEAAPEFPYGMRTFLTAGNYATGATAVQPAYPITIRAWIYVTAFTDPYAKVLFKAYNTATWSAPEGTGLTWNGTSDGAITGYIVVAGSRKTVACVNASRYLRLYEWNLVAMTYDGATMELSINGRSVGTTAQAGAIDYGGGTAQPWMLAGNSRVAGNLEQLTGAIAEACVDGSVIPLATLRRWYLRGVRRLS